MDRLQQLSYLNQALLAGLPQFSGEAAALPKGALFEIEAVAVR